MIQSTKGEMKRLVALVTATVTLLGLLISGVGDSRSSVADTSLLDNQVSSAKWS